MKPPRLSHRAKARGGTLKVDIVSWAGIAAFLVILVSLFLPWWSIRASGMAVDIYPFGVRASGVPAYDRDWVVDRLLDLEGVWVVGTLVVVSSILAFVGSLWFRPVLVGPVVLGLGAALFFHGLMRSALGDLAYGYFSGTNLVPEGPGPWGFAVGVGLPFLAGMALVVSLIMAGSRPMTPRCRVCSS